MSAALPLVPAPRVMRRLLKESPGPVTGPLSEGELAVLRAPVLDALLLTAVGGLRVPSDLVTTPGGRAGALAPLLPPGAVLMGETALWVHDGRLPPVEVEVAHATRAGIGPGVRASRAHVAPYDLVVLAGTPCATPSRAAADLARTAPPALAVGSVLRALSLGATRSSLTASLDRCRGAGVRGRPRARRIIESVTSQSR